MDDDEATRKLFRLNLGDDYEVIDTDDPEEALALAMEHKPDAILLDVLMPEFSGQDLCRPFHSFSQANLVPILAIGGALTEVTKEACAILGASAFFAAPIDFEALRSRLATIKRRAMVPRSEVRVRLKIPLKLRGSNGSGAAYEETATTENVSLSGFMCTSSTAFQKDSVVEVFFAKNGRERVARARCVRSDVREGEPTQYAFRFIEKTEIWIVQ